MALTTAVMGDRSRCFVERPPTHQTRSRRRLLHSGRSRGRYLLHSGNRTATRRHDLFRASLRGEGDPTEYDLQGRGLGLATDAEAGADHSDQQ